MKLGIFDSGLGGLIISKAIRDRIPDIDMLYLGDTLHLPYGKRSEEAIYQYTKKAMCFMFEHGCTLIVIACNTASAAALRRLQQEWLPCAYPGRNIIGVVVPTLEAAVDMNARRIGLIGTNYIIHSDIYAQELQKLSPEVYISGQATPLLVPLIEDEGIPWMDSVLASYLHKFQAEQIDSIILGCTHYCFIKDNISNILGDKIKVLSQDLIIPDKLVNYLGRHPEYADQIARDGKDEFFISDITPAYAKSASLIYGREIEIKKAEL